MGHGAWEEDGGTRGQINEVTGQEIFPHLATSPPPPTPPPPTPPLPLLPPPPPSPPPTPHSLTPLIVNFFPKGGKLLGVKVQPPHPKGGRGKR
ncbi:MAG: hypothetical protein RMY29_029290, partial [Nostoc sp. CreGUA01]